MEKTRQVILKNIDRKTFKVLFEGQLEAAKVWNFCMLTHKEVRQNRSGKWPNRFWFQTATKGKFPLHSQSVQMVCRAFDGCIKQTKENRKTDRKRKYPYKEKRFYSLLWPAQAMSIDKKRNKVILPMGRGRKSLILDKPDWLEEKSPCKIVWNGYCYEWHITTSEEDCESKKEGINATVDLGQIHLGAVVTENQDGLIVSGRGIRSQKRLLNKVSGSLQRKISKCKKGSRRFKRLVWAKKKAAASIKRKIRDMRHKATRQIVNFCRIHNVSNLFVGNPSGVQKKCSGRKHNQRMSQWEFGKDIEYIFQKASLHGIDGFKGSERGTSSTCPECNIRKKVTGRNWNCHACGFSGHRDLVGCVNMHKLAFDKPVKHPSRITYLRPGQQWLGSSRCLDTGQLAKAVAV